MARFRNYFLPASGRRSDRDHLLPDLVFVTWSTAWFAVRAVSPTAGNLSAVRLPGSGLIVAVVALTLLGFLTANLIGRTLVESRREPVGAHPAVRRSIAA